MIIILKTKNPHRLPVILIIAGLISVSPYFALINWEIASNLLSGYIKFNSGTILAIFLCFIFPLLANIFGILKLKKTPVLCGALFLTEGIIFLLFFFATVGGGDLILSLASLFLILGSILTLIRASSIKENKS